MCFFQKNTDCEKSPCLLSLLFHWHIHFVLSCNKMRQSHTLVFSFVFSPGTVIAVRTPEKPVCVTGYLTYLQ